MVGSADLATPQLTAQSVAVWGDDSFTNDVIDAAVDGDISLQIVDGIYL